MAQNLVFLICGSMHVFSSVKFGEVRGGPIYDREGTAAAASVAADAIFGRLRACLRLIHFNPSCHVVPSDASQSPQSPFDLT